MSDAGRFNGWTDVALNERGRAQGRSLRDRVASGYDGIWTSDLARAVETAALACGVAETDRRLRELDFGELEGKTWDGCPPDVRHALLEFDPFVAPGGESTSSLRDRVNDFVTSLDPGRHLLFTHGGVIRVLLRAHGTDRRVEPGEMVALTVSRGTGSRAGRRMP